MRREARALQALAGQDVPHPAFVAGPGEPDDGVAGDAVFYLMAPVEGFNPAGGLPPRHAGDATIRHEMGLNVSEAAARLGAVDHEAVGLGDFGKPDGFLERQVSRWLAQLDRYRTRDLPELEFLTDWLDANRPPMSPAGILHGDYSPFNLMVAPDPPARLAAIVDWDTGTIGDPLLDIGHLLARWVEPGEAPVITEQAGGVAGYPPRMKMAARYAELTGRDLTALPYYEALALFKLAVILEGRYARDKAAGVPDRDNMMATTVPNLMRAAAAFARGQRV
jgi:aminoglycoside phosphotransferase (APT) family kinase protein